MQFKKNPNTFKDGVPQALCSKLSVLWRRREGGVQKSFYFLIFYFIFPNYRLFNRIFFSRNMLIHTTVFSIKEKAKDDKLKDLWGHFSEVTEI